MKTSHWGSSYNSVTPTLGVKGPISKPQRDKKRRGYPVTVLGRNNQKSK